MNKQQFIEKKWKEFVDRWVKKYRLYVQEGEYFESDEWFNIANFLQSALSECWDMAGEDFAKRFITLMRRKYDLHEHMHYTEIEDNLNSLTSQKEEKL